MAKTKKRLRAESSIRGLDTSLYEESAVGDVLRMVRNQQGVNNPTLKILSAMIKPYSCSYAV